MYKTKKSVFIDENVRYTYKNMGVGVDDPWPGSALGVAFRNTMLSPCVNITLSFQAF